MRRCPSPAIWSPRLLRNAGLAVTDLLDPSFYASIIADRRFITAAAIAIFSGVVRGFSGFGSALIYMPLTAAVYDPLTAAMTS